MFSQITSTSEPRHCVIEDRWYDNTAVVHCRGVLDILTAPVLERHLAHTLADNPAAVIVDLTDIDFLASHGMAILIATHDRVSPRLPFSVVADGPTTSRPMKLVGLHELMPMHPRLDLALEYVHSSKRGALA
ncbi:hypothetical protein BVC93_21865 [Mycobacterium sp. MS1601]|nr:hypothetical protein BVC93_21865 [Mycobacterium sp. MS1601]